MRVATSRDLFGGHCLPVGRVPEKENGRQEEGEGAEESEEKLRQCVTLACRVIVPEKIRLKLLKFRIHWPAEVAQLW